MNLGKAWMGVLGVACMMTAHAQVGAPTPATAAAPGSVAAPAGGLAGLPAGAQPAPSAGAALPPQNLPPLPATPPAESQGANFDDVMAQTLGLTPEQIRELRKAANARQRAASEFPSTPPKPVNTQVTASPAPGSVPPVVRLFTGFASSVTITDATGAPWPIENFTVGHDKQFDVKRMDGPTGSTLSIVPMGYYMQSNMLLYLKGLSAPIAITFLAGQKEVDFRTDVRVQARGPNSQITVGGLPQSTSSALLSLLEGVSPAESKELKVGSPEAKAWMTKSGRLLVRTSLQVISPGWIGSTRSSDGMSAYEMMPASSLLVLKDGRIQSVSVEGW